MIKQIATYLLLMLNLSQYRKEAEPAPDPSWRPFLFKTTIARLPARWSLPTNQPTPIAISGILRLATRQWR